MPKRPARWEDAGAHWILAILADLGYPEGDTSLHPGRDQVLDTWLHEDLYWEFEATRKADILLGLRVMTELGLAGDVRCEDAFELLERKRLADGGWPAESRYYTVGDAIRLGADFVDWGGTSAKRMNPWVTVDALSVLTKAGRWEP
jgi:hypothetical protein